MSIRQDIVDGIAEILWAEGWMNHVEEHGCESLSGVDVTEVMPPIPKDAHNYAEKWAGEVEKMNGKKLDDLYEEAMAANEREEETGEELPRRGTRSWPRAFGNNLAYMIEGSGASWFDYNAKFDLETPDHSAAGVTVDLMFLAGSKCKASWENPPCEECGAFSRPGKTKCSNCGTPFEFEDEER